MKLLRADLSEMELRGLEKRFAASSSCNILVVSGDMDTPRARNTEGGIRYVELLHWGAPVQRAAKHGDDEVGLKGGNRFPRILFCRISHDGYYCQ